MVITWYGGACVFVEERARGAAPRSALFFPETKTTRARTIEEKANVVIASRRNGESSKTPYRIAMPGEYDIAGFAIRGVSLAGGGETAYTLESSDVTFCHAGASLSGRLSDRDVEALGVVDILAVPVPLRAKAPNPAAGLSELLHAVEPKIVLPLLADGKLRAAVRRELGTEGETAGKLAVASKDLPQEGFRLVYLEPQ